MQQLMLLKKIYHLYNFVHAQNIIKLQDILERPLSETICEFKE